MPQSLSKIILHITFGTKYRRKVLTAPLRYHLHAYIAEVVRNKDCQCYRCGGVSDHVHLAVRFSRDQMVSNFVGHIKSESCKWLKKQSPSLYDFSWQRGYAVFSVRYEGLPVLLRYIDRQEIHHGETDFQTEYRSLLVEHGISFDEKYVWD